MTKDKALKLAAEPFWDDEQCVKAAAELIRLHAAREECEVQYQAKCDEIGELLEIKHKLLGLNTELLEALKQALEYLRDNQHYIADNERHVYVMEYNAFLERLEALAEPTTTENNGGKTGWPPGLLQDDCKGLSKWLSNQPDARRRVREALAHATTEREQPAQQCCTDGRCQYAIDSGAEGMGHCPKGKCVMPAQQRLELIGHADLTIMNIYLFSEYGDTEIPKGRVPLYAGYKK